jgi:hypothetical protein
MRCKYSLLMPRVQVMSNTHLEEACLWRNCKPNSHYSASLYTVQYKRQRITPLMQLHNIHYRREPIACLTKCQQVIKKWQNTSVNYCIQMSKFWGVVFLEVDNIVRSAHGDKELPNVPIMSYVFPKLREGLKHWPAGKEWIVSFWFHTCSIHYFNADKIETLLCCMQN